MRGKYPRVRSWKILHPSILKPKNVKMPRPHREAARGTKNRGGMVNWCILSFLVKCLLPSLEFLPCSAVADGGLPLLISLGVFWLQQNIKTSQFSANQMNLYSLKSPKEPWKPGIFMKGVHRPYLQRYSALEGRYTGGKLATMSSTLPHMDSTFQW